MGKNNLEMSRYYAITGHGLGWEDKPDSVDMATVMMMLLKTAVCLIQTAKGTNTNGTHESETKHGTTLTSTLLALDSSAASRSLSCLREVSSSSRSKSRARRR